ncbi:MAG: glycosyl transferase, partial [Flavobacteriales bacterium CG_4_9_14_3_um_filter_32_8]
MLKRLFDIFFSLIGLVILLPFFIIIGLIIIFDSKGGIFYKQVRVGKNGKDFGLYKFRSMKTDADKKGLLTVGGRDSRITNVGYSIRKYKLDELPQLINVFIG